MMGISGSLQLRLAARGRVGPVGQVGRVKSRGETESRIKETADA